MTKHFFSKSRRHNRLGTNPEDFFYNADVDEDLWRDVGRQLKAAREERHWNAIDVYRNGGPHNNIVKQHERGRFRTLSSLTDHASVLDVAVVDLLRVALAASPDRLSAVGRALAREIDQMKPASREIVRQLVRQMRSPKPSSSG